MPRPREASDCTDAPPPNAKMPIDPDSDPGARGGDGGGADDLAARVRAYGNGSARATHSLIDRVLAARGVDDGGGEIQGGPRLARVSAIGIVKLARALEFDSVEMARLFTADTDRASAFLFAASLDAGSGPTEPDEVATWAEALADAHAVAMYHLRSQLWERAAERLASGKTMDDVLAAAADDTPRGEAPTQATFKRHTARLRARLAQMARRHIPVCAPDAGGGVQRVRWGYTSGRLPDGTWARRTESSAAFADAVSTVVADRRFERSYQCAARSFARGSVVAVADFGHDMDVSDLISEADVREVQAAETRPGDALVAAAALRTTLAKNVWASSLEQGGGYAELEVYRDGGWFPWRGTALEAARVLIMTTIIDMERARARLAMQANTATPAAGATHAITRVADMLVAATFLAPLSRASRRRYAETVAPTASVRTPPSSGSVSAVLTTHSLGPTPAFNEAGTMDADRAPSQSEYRSRMLAVESGSDNGSDGADGDGDTRRSRTGRILFVENEVDPPLRVRDYHEDAAAPGGAVCFVLDSDSGRWLYDADQARGSVHVFHVHKHLGYRGFGRSTFLVDAYGPDGEFLGGEGGPPVVAVVSYDRSALEPTVAAQMDAMERLPLPSGRFWRPVHTPYITRGLHMSRSVVSLAMDDVSPFPTVEHDPAPPGLEVTSSHTCGQTHVYEFQNEAPVHVPCEGWGASWASSHVRSAVRAHWANAGCTCPHDMRMRLSSTTTHIVYGGLPDGAIRSVRYAFTPRTLRNVWDGAVAVADERADSVVYVVDNDLPGCRHRLVIVAGLTLDSLPLATARLIEEFWRQRGQTCPHTRLDPARADADDADALVHRVDLDASDAADWLEREERFAAARAADREREA